MYGRTYTRVQYVFLKMCVILLFLCFFILPLSLCAKTTLQLWKLYITATVTKHGTGID